MISCLRKPGCEVKGKSLMLEFAKNDISTFRLCHAYVNLQALESRRSEFWPRACTVLNSTPMISLEVNLGEVHLDIDIILSKGRNCERQIRLATDSSLPSHIMRAIPRVMCARCRQSTCRRSALRQRLWVPTE